MADNPFADSQMPPLGDHLALIAGQVMGWVLKGASEGVFTKGCHVVGPYDDAAGMHQPVFDLILPNRRAFRITVEEIGIDRTNPVGKTLNEEDLRRLAAHLASSD